MSLFFNAQPDATDRSGQRPGALMAALELAPNLVELFEASARRQGERPFLWARRDGSYRAWSWTRARDEARALAATLRTFGLERGERVLIVSENRPEWAISDLAVLMAGAVTVPAYTTNTIADHAYLLSHAEIAAVVVANARLGERLFPAIREVGGVRIVVCLERIEGAAEVASRVITYDEALARAADRPEAPVVPALDDVACFIYTSGTGGRPKGVMLTHRNLLANVMGARAVLEKIGLGEDVFLSFLPLSHAYEHTAGQFLPIAVGAEIYYAEGVETLTTNLLEARPTIMACVPRLYELMRQRILNGVAREPGIRAKLFHKAVELGSRAYERPDSLNLGERALNKALDQLVRTKIRARFGGRIKALVSGGAPLNYDVGLFFTALGLPVFQGYGQTECSPVMSCNLPERVKLHTVGPPIPGLEIRIAADGEILARGESVMKGYWRDAVATRDTLRDGWLHTGDVGLIDGDGYIQITDRKRDLIVNSGGDNIAPQRVEGVLALEPEIGQVVVFGDRRPHLVALIVPDADFCRTYARTHRLKPELASLAMEPGLRAAVAAAVARANRGLSVLERVRRFHILSAPFTIEDGTMTPTLKLKRQHIYRLHGDLLAGLYEPGLKQREAG
jgi:long-chain acyl-CoA synthetase